LNQDWPLRWVRIPEGTHLSKSKDIPGVERDLLREDGTNKLLGSTESFPADEDTLYRVHSREKDSPRSADARELSPTQQALARAVEGVLDLVRTRVVIPVYREIVAPAIERKLSRVAKSLRSTIREVSGQASTTELATSHFTCAAFHHSGICG
jgi:hypothetical protein